MNVLGVGRDSQILSSALLASMTESLFLSVQTIFVASQSRLHEQYVVATINDKVCVAQFHCELFEEND
ncbi:hypothetical protein [Acinetobacter indicus]|uniref:hypothetical protein n=1 Tax=Acinetobacter indicus TaxID=756892 RepID=UPI001315A9F8|nr:hypothetical protein [Acinetobacter indicus]